MNIRNNMYVNLFQHDSVFQNDFRYRKHGIIMQVTEEKQIPTTDSKKITRYLNDHEISNSNANTHVRLIRFMPLVICTVSTS
mmetsp:Transcript_69921/g.111193  ORF Transcript_69921/g.111193 Transcript_69921/m.111193 type:complete len:82 (+) Transcript_69921:197-442(+)